MIEREVINGRDATVSYINVGPDGFELADKETASMRKIVFDDGDVVFAAQRSPAARLQKGEPVMVRFVK